MDSERRPQKVIHILDDIALGGVTRLLDSLLPALGDGFDHRRVNTRTRYRLPPRLDADIVVIHFTAAWNKMPFLLGLRRASEILSRTAAFDGKRNLFRPRFGNGDGDFGFGGRSEDHARKAVIASEAKQSSHQSFESEGWIASSLRSSQ